MPEYHLGHRDQSDDWDRYANSTLSAPVLPGKTPVSSGNAHQPYRQDSSYCAPPIDYRDRKFLAFVTCQLAQINSS